MAATGTFSFLSRNEVKRHFALGHIVHCCVRGCSANVAACAAVQRSYALAYRPVQEGSGCNALAAARLCQGHPKIVTGVDCFGRLERYEAAPEKCITNGKIAMHQCSTNGPGQGLTVRRMLWTVPNGAQADIASRRWLKATAATGATMHSARKLRFTQAQHREIGVAIGVAIEWWQRTHTRENRLT